MKVGPEGAGRAGAEGVRLPARWGAASRRLQVAESTLAAYRRRRARAASESLRAPLAAVIVLALGLAASRAAGAVKDPLDVARRSVLVTTTMNAAPGLSATLTEYLTGEKNERTAIGLLLGLHRAGDGARKLTDSRDYNSDAGGFVSRGSLQVIDLDHDGTNELVVEYHHNEKPGTTRVEMDLFRIVSDQVQLGWNGPVRIDTTSPSAGLPPSERDRFVREIDFARTEAGHGSKICFRKTVFVAAGGALDPPRLIEEELDWAGPPPRAQSTAR